MLGVEDRIGLFKLVLRGLVGSELGLWFVRSHGANELSDVNIFVPLGGESESTMTRMCTTSKLIEISG